MIYDLWYLICDIFHMKYNIWYIIYDIGHWDDILYTIYDYLIYDKLYSKYYIGFRVSDLWYKNI